MGRGQGVVEDGPFTCGVTALHQTHVRTACPEAGVAKLPAIGKSTRLVSDEEAQTHMSASFYSHVLETQTHPRDTGKIRGCLEVRERPGRLTKARGTIRGDSVRAHVWSVLVVSWPCAQVRVHQTVHLKHTSFTVGQLHPL